MRESTGLIPASYPLVCLQLAFKWRMVLNILFMLTQIYYENSPHMGHCERLGGEMHLGQWGFSPKLGKLLLRSFITK